MFCSIVLFYVPSRIFGKKMRQHFMPMKVIKRQKRENEDAVMKSILFWCRLSYFKQPKRQDFELFTIKYMYLKDAPKTCSYTQTFSRIFFQYYYYYNIIIFYFIVTKYSNLSLLVALICRYKNIKHFIATKC